MSDFKLWLEFEQVEPGSWNKENDFANIQVELTNGRTYGINVWTNKYLKTIITEHKTYLIPPDLLVQELTRKCIHTAIEELLLHDDLEKALNPGVLNKS